MGIGNNAKYFGPYPVRQLFSSIHLILYMNKIHITGHRSTQINTPLSNATIVSLYSLWLTNEHSPQLLLSHLHLLQLRLDLLLRRAVGPAVNLVVLLSEWLIHDGCWLCPHPRERLPLYNCSLEADGKGLRPCS